MGETSKKVQSLLSWLPHLVAVCSVAFAVLTWLGTRVETTPERLDAHIAASSVIHDSINAAQQRQLAAQAIVQDSLRRDLLHLHRDLERSKALSEAGIIGECLENPRENLVLQKLITICAELGVPR